MTGAAGVEVEGEAGELRELLARAEREDDARSAALDALLERPMRVATWPGSGELLRTLRNAKGEQALGLWSGHDTLATAAAQLGWRAADGSLPTRIVDAREAIEAALAQGVQYVVIDLGSEHALELIGDELSLLLAVRQMRSPKADAPPKAGPATKPGKGLIDFDLPFVHGRAEPAEEPASTAPPSRAAEAPTDLLARAFAAPTDDGPGGKDAAAALAAAAPVAPPSPPLIAVQSQAQAPAGEPGGSKASTATHGRTMLGVAAPAPAAAPPRPPPAPADDKPTQARSAAKAGGEESKPSAIKSAARALKTMIGTGDAASAASDAGAADAEAEAQVFEPGALRPLELGLSESALGAIAEALRGYPEVEWACEVSDGTEVPVIGLRVSPQFMTRAAEIEQAALAAGTARGAELRVLLLSDAAAMREARTHGSAFYPWKKRR